MAFNNLGGKLHGTWSVDTVISTSDRNLKKNIQPLVSTLRATHPDFGSKKIAEPVASKEQRKLEEPAESPDRKESVTGWVLRQLRPVSYYFKKNDAKQMRFGFIADEVEKVLPQVIRELPKEESKNATREEEKQGPFKGIAYNDLIAVLTDAVKDVSSQMKDMRDRMLRAEEELDRLDSEDPMDDDDEFV